MRSYEVAPIRDGWEVVIDESEDGVLWIWLYGPGNVAVRIWRAERGVWEECTDLPGFPAHWEGAGLEYQTCRPLDIPDDIARAYHAVLLCFNFPE